MGGILSSCCHSSDDDNDDVTTKNDDVTNDANGQFDNPGFNKNDVIPGGFNKTDVIPGGFNKTDVIPGGGGHRDNFPFRYVVGKEDLEMITSRRKSGKSPEINNEIRYSPLHTPSSSDMEDRRTSYVNISHQMRSHELDFSAKNPPNQKLKKFDQITSDYIATTSHEAETKVELSFVEGDRFVSSAETDVGKWLYVISLRTHMSGYVSRDHVISSSPPSREKPNEEEFYFGGLSRAECERKLKVSEPGTFLLRDSETKKDSLVLVVRNNSEDFPFKNYRISVDSISGSISISPHCSFPTLNHLIQHYKNPPSSFHCCPLTTPLIRDNDVTSNDDVIWEVDRGSLVLTDKLGDGSFGVVWRGIWRERTNVAVKMLKDEDKIEELLAEAEMMKYLDHPNIIRLYGVVTNDHPIFIITEFMVNGSLSSYLKEGEGRDCDVTVCIDIALQVASGMRYLEKVEVIHCDLRAANVLVGENSICKISDFGLARILSKNYSNTKQGERFPIRWTAPEAIHNLEFTLKSDVWSFGVLLYEIMTKGERPYQSFNNHDLVRHLMDGYRLPYPNHPDLQCPQSLYQLMLKCWNADSEKRPSFGSIQNHLNSVLQ